MSKLMNPRMYAASITSFFIDEIESGMLTTSERDYRDLERRAIAHLMQTGCIRGPKLVHPEIAKLLKAQPTKPIHSHEPWKQSVKRQGRQIRKSK